MPTYVDTGVRCDSHAGEVFPVRCGACENLRAEYGTLGLRLCPRHPAHFRPCQKGCDN
jgi:hypothetical protein